MIPGDDTSYIWTDGTYMDLEFLNSLWFPRQPDNNVEDNVLMWREDTETWDNTTLVTEGLELAHINNIRNFYVCKFKC